MKYLYGPNSILKSLVRPINSPRDIAMYRFWCFGLKLVHSHPFLGVFGGGNVPFQPFSIRISATVDLGACVRKKIQDNKSHKSVIFLLFGGSPHWTNSTQSCMVGNVNDII